MVQEVSSLGDGVSVGVESCVPTGTSYSLVFGVGCII